MRRAAIRCALTVVCAWLLAAFAPQASERIRVSAESAGSVPAQVETGLLLKGYVGQIRVRIGTPGEIRYASVRAKEKSAALPVEVWRSGGRFEIAPPDGAAPEAGVLEVAVPSRISVEVEAADTSVVASGLQAGLEVRGERLDVTVRGVEGGVRIEAVGGRALLEGCAGDLSLSGSGLVGRVAKAQGSLRAKVLDSALDIREMTGSIEADLTGTSLLLHGLTGPLRLKASGGTADLRKLGQGGELVLSGTPVDLKESSGDVDIQTDAALRFLDNHADLHVDGYGGSVHATGNEGLLEVKTEGAEVVVERFKGPTRVQGRRLAIELKHLDGDVFVEAVSSRITIGEAGAEVQVLSENGDVTVLHPATDVVVDSRGGDVRVLETRGPLRVVAEGSRVEISLVAPLALKDSEVRNDGGEVELRIPPNLGVTIAAETRYGRIESRVPGLRVGDGSKTAEGKLGPGGDHSTIRIQASGNILLGQKEPAGQ